MSGTNVSKTVPLQVFKAGRHTSSNGITADYPVAYLDAAIENFKATLDTHAVPVVLGHVQESGAPAVAWVKDVRRVGDVMEADIGDIDPAFDGSRYKKVSVSFFSPDSPNNPTPGSPSLRHVALLGAETPAVPGLKNVTFSASDEGVVEFSDGLLTQAGLFRSIREWILAKFGAEDADKAVPASEIGWLQTLDTMSQVEDAAEAATCTDSTATAIPAFSEGSQNAQDASTGDEQAAGNTEAATTAAEGQEGAENAVATGADSTASVQAEQCAVATNADPAATTAEATAATTEPATAAAAAAPEFTAAAAQGSTDFAARESALAAREAEFAAREAALNTRETSDFCDALLASGQLLPFQVPQAKNLLGSLYGVGATADFSEGPLPVAAAFRQFLTGLPKVVSFSEEAAETVAPTQDATPDFVAPEGYRVDESAEPLRRKIWAYAKKHDLSFAEAAQRISTNK